MKRFELIKNIAMPLVIFGLIVGGFAEDRTDRDRSSLGKALRLDLGVFDVNRISGDLENNGSFVSFNRTGASGMEWPKGSGKTSIFAAGLWIAGQVDGVTRTAAAEFASEWRGGAIVNGLPTDAAEDHLYIVYKSDLADPLASSDFQNWPAHLGAPWVDVDNDGVYDPLPNGPDSPDFIGDQVIWYVMNDESSAGHAVFSTQPLGLEVQFTIWGYDRPDAFGDMMFLRAKIYNKGGRQIDSTFISLWSDPDLGDASDDFVGNDSSLSLGYCYNDGADGVYGDPAPAVGYDYFQGPIVESPGDSAKFFGEWIQGSRNLTMSSFAKYINGDAIFRGPENGDEVYNLLTGFRADGKPFINSETGDTTKFTYVDDPNDNTGVGDGVWVDSDDHNSGDRRFLMNIGPFSFAPGDSQEVVFGVLHALGATTLGSITALKEVDALAQLAYDIDFQLPVSPSAPPVVATEFSDRLVLNWDDGVNAVESYTAVDVIDKLPVAVAWDTTWKTLVFTVDPEGDTTEVVTVDSLGDTTYVWIQVVDDVTVTYSGADTKFDFQGYNVYQYETAAGFGARKLIATYDLIDGITEVFDLVFDASRGENILVRTQFGSDNGIRRSIIIEVDAINANAALIKGREYYFAVTAYGYNPYGIPKTLENSPQIIALRPQDNLTAAIAQTAGSGGTGQYVATHSAGGSGGAVEINVVDPLLITGDNYTVTFRFNDDSSAVVWDLNNITTGATTVSGNPIQTGVDMETGLEVGAGASPIVDGFQVIVSGPALDFTNFEMVANGAGAITPPEGAAADFQGFPSLRPTSGQQVGGGFWMFNAGGGSGSYASFLGRAMRGSNFDLAVPYNFEMRFNATGSYAVQAFTTGNVVTVPFELWNTGIGTNDDASDDYKMIPWYLEIDGVGGDLAGADGDTYQIEPNDHGTSGGTDDPYTPWIYWRDPVDTSPGTAGYDAFVASLDLVSDPPTAELPNGTYDYASPEVIARSILVNWNGGDVTDPGGGWTQATWAAFVTQLLPEEGSIIRLTTTKPNASDDIFTFSTDTLAAAALTADIEDVSVWPNPYLGFNPEESNPLEYKVNFTHLPGDAEIRIYNLAGQLVRKLELSGGSQFATWDMLNSFDFPIASGMYIIRVTSATAGEKILKLAVVMPEQRLTAF